MKNLFISLGMLLIGLTCSSWGFYAHTQINYLAVFCLPPLPGKFFKSNISYLRAHAVDPDMRRYADTSEAPRHYLDVEQYETVIDSIPRRWNDALKRYGAKKLHAQGILPWQIHISYLRLVSAFEQQDSLKILKAAADLGHYIADAHVPLHTTENHNGQLSNQVGIHAFWESRIPELFADKYNFVVGKAYYIAAPLTESWRIVSHTHSLVDSTLTLELKVGRQFRDHQKYEFSKRKGKLLKQYSKAYALAYSKIMDNMVEKQMSAAVLSIASFWYSAWVDAGQPELDHLTTLP
ncbi:MAG: S1/P1 Nuclease [Pedobacter sp.]|nr:MAG: S1/P1 Nuclease [Pedobacter sp.]